MDYSHRIKTWQEWQRQCSLDDDGVMHADVRSLLQKLGPEYIGLSLQRLYAATWKEYKGLKAKKSNRSIYWVR